jgi:16S rRNA processing protein RimM
MIREEEVFYIGRITKYRGISGEVELLFTDDAFDRGNAEYLVFNIDGIYVPFFWEEYRFKNNDTAIFKFEDSNDEEDAKKLVGIKVYYPKCCLPESDSEELHSWKSLTGFTVFTESGIRLGTVENVDDSSANILFTICDSQGEELLIPFHDDFLVDYQLKERTLTLELPEGLLELNT